jgi:hypothetical protein
MGEDANDILSGRDEGVEAFIAHIMVGKNKDGG